MLIVSIIIILIAIIIIVSACCKPWYNTDQKGGIIYFVVVVAIILLAFNTVLADKYIEDNYEYTTTETAENVVISRAEIVPLPNNQKNDVFVITTDKEYCWYEQDDFYEVINSTSMKKQDVSIKYCSQQDNPERQTVADIKISHTRLKKEPNILFCDIEHYLVYRYYSVGDELEEHDERYYNEKTVLVVPEGSVQEN